MKGYPENEFKLADLFSRSLFVVPKYQREYSWEASHVRDLLDDIEFVLNREEQNSDIEHYFGTIVLEEREKVEGETVDFEKFSIVDGQQRITTHTILVKSLLEELEWIKSQGISEETNEEISGKIQNWRSDYIQKEGKPKLRLGDISQQTYQKIVIEGDKPEEVNTEVEHSAGEKLLNAKITIRNRIEEWREDYREENNEDWLRDYKNYLNSVLKTSTHKLKVTVKSVDDMDEAARMFKVINNRGKDLTLFDKVKSHVVYAASRSELDVKQAYKDFGEIVRNVTKYEECGDQELDQLIKAHWIGFAGEPSPRRTKYSGPSKIHKRISEVENFGHIENDNLEEWLTAYIDSLKEVSEFYVELSEPRVFLAKHSNEEGEHIEKIRNRLQGLNVYGGARATFAPLFLSVVHNYGIDSEEFCDVLDIAETLVFRYNIVLAEGSNHYKNLVHTASSKMFWSMTDDKEIETIFNSGMDRYKGYESGAKGIIQIKKKLKKRTRELCPDGRFEEHLVKMDVLSGEYTNGWGGIRPKSGIKYLLYEYERNLRKGSDSDMNGFQTFIELDDSYEIEHLVPKNAEAGHKLNPHDKNKNRLGNLALIGKEDNKKEGRSSYRDKYHALYKNSSIKMLNRLNEPEMKVKNVKKRGEKIADFAVKRWSIEERSSEL